VRVISTTYVGSRRLLRLDVQQLHPLTPDHQVAQDQSGRGRAQLSSASARDAADENPESSSAFPRHCALQIILDNRIPPQTAHHIPRPLVCGTYITRSSDAQLSIASGECRTDNVQLAGRRAIGSQWRYRNLCKRQWIGGVLVFDTPDIRYRSAAARVAGTGGRSPYGADALEHLRSGRELRGDRAHLMMRLWTRDVPAAPEAEGAGRECRRVLTAKPNPRGVHLHLLKNLRIRRTPGRPAHATAVTHL